MNTCIFCKIIEGKAPAKIVYESDQVVAFHDIHPKAPVHILIVPRKHIPRIADLEPEDHGIMGEVIGAAKAVAEQFGVGDGFRLVVNNGAIAGQSVFHIHFHLLAGRCLGWPPG
nr:histidine triad nucleotide-binding protein [Anaerolineae bacterium]